MVRFSRTRRERRNVPWETTWTLEKEELQRRTMLPISLYLVAVANDILMIKKSDVTQRRKAAEMKPRISVLLTIQQRLSSR